MRELAIIIPFIMLIACNKPADPVISADFPGGNIVLVEQDKDTFRLLPDLSGTEGNWFYWYFKVTNISGRTLSFKFMMDNMFTSAGPSYSINNNREWRWLGDEQVCNNTFTFTFSEDDTVAYFSMAVPYTQSNFDEFLDRLGNNSMIKRDTLAISHEGRVIERVHLVPDSGNPEARILLTVRHHACEMMASYVLEGIMESVLQEPSLEFLRSQVEFMIIPFVDKDGVENGEQGKNRVPRDHNRDYYGESIYASTAALREELPAWADGKLRIAMDLHCPCIRGKWTEWIYMLGIGDPEIDKQLKRFSDIIEQNNKDALKFKSEHFIPFGVSWNTGNNTSKGQSFAHWAADLGGISLATTLEFPYGVVLGEEVTPDRARDFGHALALSFCEYLQEIK